MSGHQEGGCGCGTVRYRLETEPMMVHCCHCKDCQRQTGSAFVLNGIIETNRITLLSGNPEPTRMPTDSGRPHDIYRCTKCQTALWSDYGGRPGLRFVRMGTLDNAASVTPYVHIFTRSKVPWVAIPESVPAFDVFYDKTFWPPEAAARRAAATTKPG